eukprot:s411_g12.t1
MAATLLTFSLIEFSRNFRVFVRGFKAPYRSEFGDDQSTTPVSPVLEILRLLFRPPFRCGILAAPLKITAPVGDVQAPAQRPKTLGRSVVHAKQRQPRTMQGALCLFA